MVHNAFFCLFVFFCWNKWKLNVKKQKNYEKQCKDDPVHCNYSWLVSLCSCLLISSRCCCWFFFSPITSTFQPPTNSKVKHHKLFKCESIKGVYLPTLLSKYKPFSPMRKGYRGRRSFLCGTFCCLSIQFVNNWPGFVPLPGKHEVCLHPRSFGHFSLRPFHSCPWICEYEIWRNFVWITNL